MMLEFSLIILLSLALYPAGQFVLNLPFYRRAPRPAKPIEPTPKVSILIPARNEEHNIGDAVACALASRDVDLEVIVLDDKSDDKTAAIVLNIADPRVRLIHGVELPSGWCGKQHACHQLGHAATEDYLLFVDADARIAPDAASRLVAAQHHLKADLLSGIPHQITGTWSERLLLPLIHFLLLAFLPMIGMRNSPRPAFAAGCGQLMFFTRKAYLASGGHSLVRASLHDGLTLPKAIREAGFHTDLVDATDLVEVRMYTNWQEVKEGLMKNATEGIAAPGRIIPMTLILVGGQVLPFLFLIAALVSGSPTSTILLAATACGLSLLPRLLAAGLYRQSLVSAIFHPLGIALLLVLQWVALLRHRRGQTASWKGREYSSTSNTPPP